MEQTSEAKEIPVDQPEYIAHDWCGWNDQYGRFTHMPSGKTLVCQQHHTQRTWDKAQLEFFEQFGDGLVIHKNYQNGPYRETGDTLGDLKTVKEKLKENIRLS